jgi:hypothetical protein
MHETPFQVEPLLRDVTIQNYLPCFFITNL